MDQNKKEWSLSRKHDIGHMFFMDELLDKVRRETKAKLKEIGRRRGLSDTELLFFAREVVYETAANLVNEAALLAVRRNKNEVGMEEFEEAVERIVAGLEKKNRLINASERETVAHHEMGHAMVALSLPGTDPVQKISIIPRGVAALGYTMQVPTGDRFLMRKTELENKIASLLGGRAAEELIFGDISTGAHNDLARATDIAGSMIREYGMSERLGQVYLAADKQPLFLGSAPRETGDYSEATAEIIDQEIREIVHRQYNRALVLLTGKKEVLVRGARLLLEKEKIDGTEIQALLAESAASAGAPSASVAE